jgi:lipopolysaccharide transport system permease protein
MLGVTSGAAVPLARRLVHLRDVLRELVVRDLKLRYKRSLLGVAWSLLNPLTQVLVFTFLFRAVVPIDVPNYPVFVFCGVLIWSWFQASVLLAAGAVTDTRELIRRPGFPAAVLPVATVATHMFHFLLGLPILLVFLLLGGGRPTGIIVALPLLIALQFALSIGLAFLVAALHVTFRDTQHLLGILLVLLFYLTPVFYDAVAVPERFRPIYRLNPMVHLVEAYRAILLGGTSVDIGGLLFVAVIAAGLCWIGYRVFKHASYAFAEEL